MTITQRIFELLRLHPEGFTATDCTQKINVRVQAEGGGAFVQPSTVSSALARLVAEGRLTRTRGGPRGGFIYRLPQPADKLPVKTWFTCLLEDE